MIAQEYDDRRIFGYLESTVHDTDWMGDIARALVGRERQTYSGARERVYLGVSPHCSCDAQIQAANLLRTAISFVINCRTAETRR